MSELAITFALENVLHPTPMFHHENWNNEAEKKITKKDESLGSFHHISQESKRPKKCRFVDLAESVHLASLMLLKPAHERKLITKVFFSWNFCK